MLLKFEVAHETQRSVRKSQNRWDSRSVELLSSPQKCTIASQCYDIVDLVLNIGGEGRCDILSQAELLALFEVLHLCQ